MGKLELNRRVFRYFLKDVAEAWGYLFLGSGKSSKEQGHSN